MSGAGQTNGPASPHGPCEAFIRQIWEEIWKTQEDGGVFEHLVAAAEASIANFAACISVGNQAAALDLQRAKNWHLIQSQHFAVHRANLQTYREQIADTSRRVHEQTSAFDQHVVRSLTLANGAIVIAALAYIQTKSTIPDGMIAVIVLCSVGYLLTLLGSYFVVVLSSPISDCLLDLQNIRLADTIRKKKDADLRRASKYMIWMSHPIFFASAICLAAALYIGIQSLRHERPPVPPSAVSKPQPKASLTSNPKTMLPGKQ